MVRGRGFQPQFTSNSQVVWRDFDQIQCRSTFDLVHDFTVLFTPSPTSRKNGGCFGRVSRPRQGAGLAAHFAKTVVRTHRKGMD